MWYYGCATCFTIICVSGDAEEHRRLIVEHPQWHAGRPCFTTGCHGKISSCAPMPKTYARRLLDLTPAQFFRALCGGGTPEEVEVKPEQVRSLLLGSKIVSVDLHEMMGDGRVIVDRLHLNDGAVLHFAGTGAGALIYKVTKNAQAYDQVGVQSAAEDGALRRESQGLPTEAGPVAGDATVPGRHLPGGHDGLDAGGGERVPDELPHGRGSGHQDTAGEPVSRGTEDDGGSAAAANGVDP